MERATIAALAGDSGCGKSTFVNGLRHILGPENVLVVEMDDYHTLDRQQRRQRGVTPLHPEANDLDLAAEHLARLREGEAVTKPTYNHATGTFGAAERVEPRPFVIANGLLPFYTPALRAVLDLQAYVDTHTELKLRWKIRRDVEERGHRLEDVMTEIVNRLDDFRNYVDVQKAHTDFLLSYVPPFGAGEGVPWLWIAEPVGNAPLVGHAAAPIARGFPARRLPLDLYGRAMEAIEVRQGASGSALAGLLAEMGEEELAGRAADLDWCEPHEVGQWLFAWRLRHERAGIVHRTLAAG